MRGGPILSTPWTKCLPDWNWWWWHDHCHLVCHPSKSSDEFLRSPNPPYYLTGYLCEALGLIVWLNVDPCQMTKPFFFWMKRKAVRRKIWLLSVERERRKRKNRKKTNRRWYFFHSSTFGYTIERIIHFLFSLIHFAFLDSWRWQENNDELSFHPIDPLSCYTERILFHAIISINCCIPIWNI